MTRKLIQTKKTTLSYSISDSATSFQLDELLKLDGTSIAAIDIGDLLYGTFDPGTSKEEIFSIASSGVVINADGTVSVTGAVRGLREVDPYTTGGFATDHGAGAVVVFGNNPQVFAELAFLANDNTFEGLNIFEQAPQSEVDPVSPNDLTRLAYVQALVLGTLTTINVIVPGKAGETITGAGKGLYFDETDNEWKLWDADIAAKVNNVLLGVSQGAGTDGNAIAGGVLLQGVDDNQSGLVEGDTLYASNTAGAFSTTPGTNEVTVGISKSATEVYFNPRFNQQLTEDQQDALAGNNTDVAVGTGNKYVTQTGLQHNAEKYAVDTSGSTTAYVVTLSPAPTSLTAGMVIYAKIISANTTTTPTLNPNGLGAKTIVKYTNTALAIGDIGANSFNTFIYDGTNLVLKSPDANLATPPTYPIGEQDIPYQTSTTVAYASALSVQSSITGDVLFMCTVVGNNFIVFRLLRDVITKEYVITNTVTHTGAGTASVPALHVTGSYVYLSGKDNVTNIIKRFDIADLANITSITISGTTFTQGGAGFSNGTDLYIYDSTNIFNRYTISGTTATFASAITYTSSGSVNGAGAACDGTNVYTTVVGSDPSYLINKYPLAGGAATSSITRIINKGSYPNVSKLNLFIPRSDSLGFAYGYTTESNSAVVGSTAKIGAIAIF